MKKLFIALLLIMLTASGCRMAPAGPETFSANNKTYKTGFYGNLYPNEFSLTEHTTQSRKTTLVRIEHETFELYYADIGPYVSGTIYCEESQYAYAAAYYNDPTNYAFFCELGWNKTDGTRTKTVKLSNVDITMFEALLRFSNESYYDPFDKQHNSKIEIVELPLPDETRQTRMVFYKESKDALFCSPHTDYYIYDNELYMAYQYHYGDEESQKLLAVKAPEDISTYFTSFMESYLQ